MIRITQLTILALILMACETHTKTDTGHHSETKMASTQDSVLPGIDEGLSFETYPSPQNG